MISYKKILDRLPFHKKQPDKPDLEKFMAQMALAMEEAHSKALDQAHAAAAEGTGPQTWDADWFENELDLGEEALALTENWSWQHVQALQEALDWALASPQGQRAQARQEEESAPESTTLQMIQDLQLGLTWRSNTLLSQQAKALGYSRQQMENLQDALAERLYLEINEKDA